MTSGARLVCGASAMLLLTLAVRASQPDRLPVARNVAAAIAQVPVARNFSSAADDYLGSASCARCHDVEHQQWRNSLHVKMTKPIAEAAIAGDFSDGTRFTDHDRSYTLGMKDGKPFMTVAFGTAPPQTFPIDYTLGAKRYQGYLSTLPDGSIYVLPAFWHIATKRWIDWKEITPIPDTPHDIRQIWNINCFNCHGTNIVQGFDVAAKAYRTSWTEMGIGCEACHGPGREHVATMARWEKDPASKPAYDNSSKNRQLSDILKIFSTRSSEPRRVYDTCAYCHGNKTNVFVGFKGGDRFADYALPMLISEPIPPHDLQGEFWPDGRPNRFNRPQALTLSGCFKAGAIVCTNCHVAHGSRNDFSLKVNINQGRNGDSLCTQCHTESRREPGAGNRELKPSSPQALKPSFVGAALEQHTHHNADSAGSRCISCHMSDVNWRLLIRRRDHTFQPPVPENTAQFGVPNACTTCHDNKSPEWAAKQMNEWWGDGDRRSKAVSLADTMYRAGSGDPATLPGLARLAVDRSQGLLVRASAAEFIARLIFEGRSDSAQRSGSMQAQTAFAGGSTGVLDGGSSRGFPTRVPPQVTPVIVNSLIGAADDPEPVVRAAALKALGTIGDRERALGPVLARLVDQTRVVRARAAEVLVLFGVVELPGNAGQALRRAQEEYILSLDMFPDVASNHAAKGWIEAERGNIVQARDALDKAVAVQPEYAFPWVVKGVLLAREGRFVEAVEMWKKARSIEPSYPNIDQLIAEAEKRK
ncbi:MAG: cytochrome c3 family protein [Acidobacteriota bacterium]|nr:cytochrome c3 family protein [Acidobacteriota bacterium]